MMKSLILSILLLGLVGCAKPDSGSGGGGSGSAAIPVSSAAASPPEPTITGEMGCYLGGMSITFHRIIYSDNTSVSTCTSDNPIISNLNCDAANDSYGPTVYYYSNGNGPINHQLFGPGSSCR